MCGVIWGGGYLQPLAGRAGAAFAGGAGAAGGAGGAGQPGPGGPTGIAAESWRRGVRSRPTQMARRDGILNMDWVLVGDLN